MERKEYLHVFYDPSEAEDGVDEAVAQGYRVKLISQSMIRRSNNNGIDYALAVVFEPDPDYEEFPRTRGPIDPADYSSKK